MVSIESYDWKKSTVADDLQLATSLRDTNRFASYLLSCRVLDFQVPSSRSATLEQRLKAYENLSIVSYYIGKKEIGEAASLKLLAGKNLDHVYNNLKFYRPVKMVAARWRYSLPHPLSQPLTYSSLYYVDGKYHVEVDGMHYETDDPDLLFYRSTPSQYPSKVKIIDSNSRIEELVLIVGEDKYQLPYPMFPFTDQSQLYLLASLSPLKIVKVTSDGLVDHIDKSDSNDTDLDDIYTVTCEPVAYRDGWLVLARIGQWLHRFIWYSKDWTDCRPLSLIYLDFEKRQERVDSMISYKDGVMIAYSNNNRSISLMAIDSIE